MQGIWITIMFYKRLIDSYIFLLNYLKGKLKRTEKNIKSIRLQKLDKLDSSLFINVNNVTYAHLELYTHCLTINDYIKTLKDITVFLESDKKISKTFEIPEVLCRTVSSFFLSGNNHYIDEKASLDEFKVAIERFFIKFEECVLHEVGIMSYNARLLSRFTQSLELTLDSLLDIQTKVLIPSLI
jgi:hypothetical protein